MFRRPVIALVTALVICISWGMQYSMAEDSTIIKPEYEVPEYVTWLLEVARGELGYRQGDHGYSKYGEWSGDPYAQWCAEFLCWCVDQVDLQHGTNILRNQYPLYSGQNVGRDWFISHGRYLSANGHLDDWGYQWLRGSETFAKRGDYIPQPGDWIFFTWTSGTDTDHVALVQYCSRGTDGSVIIHVIEGNAPVAVARNTYRLSDRSILGFGTVHAVCYSTLKHGASGQSVRQLQQKLIYMRYLQEGMDNGFFGDKTQKAVKQFQQDHRIRRTGICNLSTITAIDNAYLLALNDDPNTWTVIDED